MIELLKDWKGKVKYNDKVYDTVETLVASGIEFKGHIDIELLPASKNATQIKSKKAEPISDGLVYRITVKQYMTQKSWPKFDFMQKWNDDNPMPIRTMIGTIEQETRGMVYMNLTSENNRAVKWSGWIIKSAIMKKEIVDET